MVLHLTESRVISTRDAGRVKEVLSRHVRTLRPAAEALHDLPERHFPAGSPGVLYVHQREFAVLPLEDTRGPQIVGTDEATTCHIVVLLSKKCQILTFAHVDGSGIEEFFSEALHRMTALGDDFSLGIDVHLVGGFLDPQRESKRLSDFLLRCMARSPVAFHLQTAAISDLNDEFRSRQQLHFPRRYGLAVDVTASREEGQLRLVPASFEAFGPCPELRRTRFCSPNDRMSSVYNADSAQLELEPFDYSPPCALERLVDERDDILRQFSTSPMQERPGFESRLRSTLRYMLQHPQPRTDIFATDKPLAFRLDKGDWLPVDQ